MRVLATLVILLSTFVSSHAQNRGVSSYKDLSGNGEVFFGDLISSIQNQKLGVNDTGFLYLDSAVAFYTANNDICGLSSAYAVRARLYDSAVRYDSATKYYLSAAKIAAACTPFNRYYLYNSWAMLKENMKEYEQSDSLYNLAFNEAIQLDNKVYELNVLNNQANLQSKLKHLPEAIRLMKQINALAEEYDIKPHKLTSLQNLGAYYTDTKMYDSALFYLLALNGLITEEAPTDLVMDMYNNLGVVYYYKNQLDLADEYYMKAIQLAKRAVNPSKLLLYLSNYAFLKHEQQDDEAAWQYITEYMALKDSLFNLEKFGTIAKYEAQYKNVLQREQLLSQKLEIEQAKRNRNILFFTVSALFLILAGVYTRLRYTRRSKKIVEREKNRSDELLRNILPDEVAEELKETGSSAARNFANATVLFTDFKGFTELSEKLSAEEVVGEINFYFKKFDEIVQKFDIEKIKTIGDSYMAVGGLPVESPESAKNTVLAAFAMLKVVADHNEVNERLGKPLFYMRVGIHSGPVVAGIVGLKKFQYDIWGDTVNTASRMETAGTVGKVNISGSTYNFIKDEAGFEFEDRGEIETKGKGMLKMYFVTQTS
jgi:class 3 adenylate cyclase